MGLEAFYSKVKEYYKFKGLTQDDLATAIKLDRSTLANLLNGKRGRVREPLVQNIIQFLAEKEALAFRAEAIDLLEEMGLTAASFSEKEWNSPPLNRLKAETPPPPPDALLPCIGRKKELKEITGLLREPGVRLLTLSGVAGTGKTRLGLEVIKLLTKDFKDGLYFVGLASISDPALVASTIARALGVKEARGQTFEQSLKQFLRDRQLLLALDNFEQLLSAAPLVEDLLRFAPGLKVLVTSREILHLKGEHQYVVPPLALPDLERLPSLTQLAQVEAVAFFHQQARTVRHDFAITEKNAPTIAEICVRLDGLPLSIELAARRVKLFPPQTILSQLTQSLSTLAGRVHDPPTRHDCLQAALDWSYNLLTAREKQLFARLGVFAGGCTAEAAEAVAGIKQGDRPVEILEELESLLDKSLLKHEEGIAGQPRFLMLETLREYALERLAEGDELARLKQQHARYYLKLAEQAEPHLQGARQFFWMEQLEQDHNNLRAVLGWSLENEEGLIASELAGAVWKFWNVRNYYTEGRRWLETILHSPASQITNLQRAKILNATGVLTRQMSDLGQAKSYFEESLRLYTEDKQEEGMAMALNSLGNLYKDWAEYKQASRIYEESITLYRKIGDNAAVGRVLSNLGIVAEQQSDFKQAINFYEESIALLREAADWRGLSIPVNNLGVILASLGDYSRAESYYQESLEIWRELGDRQSIAMALSNLGNLAIYRRDYNQAIDLYQQSLSLRRQVGDKAGCAIALNNLGETARQLGDYTKATAYCQEGLALRRELANKYGMGSSLNNLGWIALSQGNYPQAYTYLTEALTVRNEIGDKFGLTRTLEGVAAVFEVNKQAVKAALLFGAAEKLRETLKVIIDEDYRPEYEQIVNATRTQLDEAVFAAAWEEGRAMPSEQLMAHALAPLVELPVS